MITPKEVDAATVRQAALTVLERHMGLAVHGYKCDSEMILDVVLKAASERRSIEAACAELATVADSNTIREHLNRAFKMTDLRQQETALNEALSEWLPEGVKNQVIDLALDTHDEPFYGHSPELVAHTCRGPARAGTTHFVRVATAYLIWRGCRLTLAVTYVEPQEALVKVVKRLLKRVHALGVRWSVLYLDKGFCRPSIMRYLQAKGQAALIACPIQGQRGGLRALCRGRRSFTTTYTFHSGTRATVALYPARVRDKKTNRRRIQWLAYVLINLGWRAMDAFAFYRRRFGIESAYRLSHQAKVLTSSRNPALRFFLVSVALLLENVWIQVRNVVARLPGPGRPRLAPLYFPFRHFLHFLAHAIEAVYGVVLRCPALTAHKTIEGSCYANP